MTIPKVQYESQLSIDEVLDYLIILNNNDTSYEFTVSFNEGYVSFLRNNYYFVLKSINLHELEHKLDHEWRQSRDGFEKLRIDEYKKMNINTMPPIVIINDIIIDGYHRYLAAKKQGKEKILAYINKEKPILNNNYEYN